jgi:two-component system sensor histidine kinase KdpD
MANSIVTRWINLPRIARVLAQSLTAIAVIASLTSVGFSLHASSLTMGCLYFVFVVTVASLTGFRQATFASLLAVAMLDYYFVPPIFSFSMAVPQDYVALAGFEAVALVISRLHAIERKGSREVIVHRTSMEQLYELSRSLLLMDMRQAPGSQLVVLIHRIFNAKAVSIYDFNLGRQDRAGEWSVGEEDVAKDLFLLGSPQDNHRTDTAQRILQTGSGRVGALVVRGELSPLIVDALASLTAIAIDRHQSFEKEEISENASKGEQLRAAVMDALAHEFKTPLTAMQTSSSGLLELGGLTDLQRDLVTLIDDETSRLNKLCTRLLVTAKLEAEQMGLQTDDVNVKELVSEVLAANPSKTDSNRIQIAVDPELNLFVDRGLLAMILEQYIHNALKYSTPGTLIDIAARASHAEVILSVHNYGPTIRIEDRERVFDRFYRAPDLKDSVSGTGIGLSVVRKAAEAHHGHVWVISDDKEGTTFFLSLPTGARRKL